MHPTPVFHWDTHSELVAFVTARAFATVCATVDGALVAAQVPVLVDASGTQLALHLSRANPLARALPQQVLVLVAGADAYVSPDWYDEPHQVPTWNYVSVEIRGELVGTDDAQSTMFEARIAGKPPWALDKLPAATLAAKLKGIVGATLQLASVRGTRKLSQNKTDADRAGIVTALDASPRAADREIAGLVRTLRS